MGAPGADGGPACQDWAIPTPTSTRQQPSQHAARSRAHYPSPPKQPKHQSRLELFEAAAAAVSGPGTALEGTPTEGDPSYGGPASSSHRQIRSARGTGNSWLAVVSPLHAFRETHAVAAARSGRWPAGHVRPECLTARSQPSLLCPCQPARPSGPPFSAEQAYPLPGHADKGVL